MGRAFGVNSKVVSVCRPDRLLPPGLYLLLALVLSHCGGSDATSSSERPHPPADRDVPPALDSARSAYHAGDFTRTDSLARLVLADPGTQADQRRTALGLLGVSLDRRGYEDSARVYLEQALQLSLLAGDSDAVASDRQDLGMVHCALGDYPKALSYQLAALHYREYTGDSTGISNGLNNTAKVLYLQGDDRGALNGFRRSYAIDRALGDSLGMSITMNNMARVLVETARYDSAIALLRANRAFRARIQPQRSMAAIESNLASAFTGQQQWDSALVHAELTIREALDHDQQDMEALGLIGEARALRGKGDPERALDAAQQSLAISERTDRTEQISEAHKMLSSIYADMGRFEAALRHAELHHQLADSLVNRDRDRTIAEMRARFQVAERERENVELSAQRTRAEAREAGTRSLLLMVIVGAALILLAAWVVVLRSRARSQRREQELEQQVLRSQMDPHFLFNALNTIPGLYSSGDPDAANDHVGHLSKFLRLVLETSHQRWVPLSEEIELLRHYLKISSYRMPGRFTWEIEVPPYVKPHSVGIPPMLIQPIVENALEHGLAGVENGHVRVRIDLAGTVLHVEVSDNGIGRTAASSRPSRRNGRPMGIALVRQRIALFDRRTPAHEMVVVRDGEHPNGRPSGTVVTIRMRVKPISDHAAIGHRG